MNRKYIERQSLLVSVFVYYVTALTASPFASGFLYNFLRSDSLTLAFRMFLSHAKANLIDYFVRAPGSQMEALQRVLYCGVAILTLVGTLIRVEKIIAPPDIERDTGSTFGSLYGIASHSPVAAFLRHPNRSRRIGGLYFAGGSAHPGGGMPLALLSGMLAAELAEKHES